MADADTDRRCQYASNATPKRGLDAIWLATEEDNERTKGGETKSDLWPFESQGLQHNTVKRKSSRLEVVRCLVRSVQQPHCCHRIL
jgi:hypothetical protein